MTNSTVYQQTLEREIIFSRSNRSKLSISDAKLLVALAVICLTIFLPVCILTPCYYGDDGGYMRMLSYFIDSGTVDHMHWSQPTAIGYLVVASLITKVIGFGFAQMDFVGLLFAITSVCGIYRLARSQLPQGMAFGLALSIFCFNEVTQVTPTFMTDMPFLAYSVWLLVFTDRLLQDKKTPYVGTYVGWSLSLLLALLTRSTGLLVLPALLTAAIFCKVQRKQLLILSALSVACSLVAAAITRVLAVNQMSLLETSALRQIILLHEFARFDIRAAVLAALSILFAVSPLLVAIKASRGKVQIIRICSGFIGAGAAVYFSQKGLFQPLGAAFTPLVVGCVAISSFNLPVVFVEAIRTNKVFSLILMTMLVFQLAVMPIMSHPVTRHAIPAMVALTVIIATANAWQRNGAKLIFALAGILILNNVIVLQQLRLTEFATFVVARSLGKAGVPARDIDAGWGWFCYTALVPGGNDPINYIDKYNTLRERARFFIGSLVEAEKRGRLLTRFQVQNFALKTDIGVSIIKKTD